MKESSNPLPSEWITRLFQRLHALYGNRLTTVYGDAPASDVHDAWAEELGGFIGEDIAHGLDAMRRAHPSYPPTLFEFAGLCRDSRERRAQTTRKLSGPPPRSSAESLELLQKAAATIGVKQHDPKAWAHRIAQRQAEGDRTLPPIANEFAREVLGLTD